MKSLSFYYIPMLLPLCLMTPAHAQSAHPNKVLDIKNAHLPHHSHHALHGYVLHTGIKAATHQKAAKQKWKPSNPNYKAEDSFE